MRRLPHPLARRLLLLHRNRGSSGSTPEWFPTDIGGCVLWLRSDLGAYQDAEKTVPCTADSLIWTGEDQVGVGGNDLIQATESKRFVYKANILDGHPAWRADGIDDWMVNTTGSIVNMITGDKKPYSIFIVAQTPTPGTGTLAGWGGHPAIHLAMWISRHSHLGEALQSFNLNSGAADVDTNPHYQLWTSTGEVGNGWLDSVQIVTNGAAYPGSLTDWWAPDKFVMGYQPSAGEGTWQFVGDYFEMAVYDNEISEASRTLLNNYAAARYPSI